VSRVVVVGSLACDFVMRVQRRPERGETIIGKSFDTFVGGKGNNQALACARAGGDVAMVGRVGTDGFGDMVLAELARAGVDHRFVVRDAEVGTGIADIQVDERGDNYICVAPRANARLSPADVEAAASVIEGAAVVLLQLEIPHETAVAAARIGKRCGATVVLNPAPAPPALPRELCEHLDVIVPNEVEAGTLTGHGAGDAASAEQAARELQARGVPTVIVTMGERGALLLQADDDVSIARPFAVNVVDTTAAGDAFCGALAAAIAARRPLRAAVAWACAAGALACTTLGAGPSLPAREAIDRLADSARQ
jgi:ribokinase